MRELPFVDFVSGKRHSKCIGKRIVAGSVIKESYGKEKQQHTFTVRINFSNIFLLLSENNNYMSLLQHWFS
jgi:hypothetical protein